MNDVAKREPIDAIESLVIEGDLSKLNAEQRVQYYHRLCESLGLNAMTRPFEYLRLSGKLVLYARKDASEQLRVKRHISIRKLSMQTDDGIYTVTAQAEDGTGRTDEDMGAVPIEGLKGEALANAKMKAVTKAKRRVTLSISGLGFLDETELDSIPGAQRVPAETVELEAPLPLTDDQFTVLTDLIRECEQFEAKGLDKFLKFMSDRLNVTFKAVSELPASEFTVAKRTLENHLEKLQLAATAKAAKEKKHAAAQ